MRVKKPKECAITAVFRMRGQAPETTVVLCDDWEQAIQKARRWLPNFEQRNPWLYCDSCQRKLYVLLDPEAETWAGTLHPKRTSSPVRTRTKKGELW